MSDSARPRGRARDRGPAARSARSSRCWAIRAWAPSTSALTRSTMWRWLGNLAGCVLGYLGVDRARRVPRDAARRAPPAKAASVASWRPTLLEPDAPAPEPGRPGDAGVRRQPGLHVVRDGRRPAGPAIPGLEHLRLDQRDRRAAGRAFASATSWAARSPTSSRTRSRRAGCSWRRRSSP